MAKKRTSLEALFSQTALDEDAPDEVIKAETTPERSQIKRENTKAASAEPKMSGDSVGFKGDIVKQTVYLPAGVHEQLRLLAFEERRKMHDYLVEGLDRVFKDRGLKPFDELTNSKK